jgi:hypothetical protein
VTGAAPRAVTPALDVLALDWGLEP